MKLYYHPVSTTSRPIVLFANEAGIPLEYEVVDLFTGAQYQPEYVAINPSRQVPVLQDDDFRLTESSAILKYLADKTGSSAYPADLRKRARVNERMDWLNTGFYRDFAYGFVYPQIFPFMRRSDDKVQAATIAWGKDKALNWLKVLDENLIGPTNAFLCGDEITLADYFGADRDHRRRCHQLQLQDLPEYLSLAGSRQGAAKLGKGQRSLLPVRGRAQCRQGLRKVLNARHPRARGAS